MNFRAKFLLFRFRKICSFAFKTEKVNTKTCRQSSQRTITAGIGSRDDTNEENYSCHRAKMMKHYFRKQLVSACRYWNTLRFSHDVECNTKYQKQSNNRNHRQTHRNDILLCRFQIPTTQILLHHILVETIHCYGYENAAEELFHEIIPAADIGDYQFGIWMVEHLSEQTSKADIQQFGNKYKT